MRCIYKTALVQGPKNRLFFSTNTARNTMDSEKQQLEQLGKLHQQQAPYAPVPRQSSVWKKLGSAALAFTVVGYMFCPHSRQMYSRVGGHVAPLTGDSLCPTQPKLVPEGYTNLDFILRDKEYAKEELKRFQGAIQIPTQSYDDMGPVDEDPRWDVFYNLSSYLKDQYPLVYKHLKVDTINTHGLVYTWEGTNKDLAPQLLMAHQDVVPVNDETAHKWEHPPFSGHYDGKYIWGRGSVDTKNTVIGSLSAAELLLKDGFKPERTHVFAYGFDEEISGPQGAKFIAEHLVDKYGSKSFFSILDEGAGVMEGDGFAMVLAGTGEKGYLDVQVTVNTPGGHSSMPPPHTGIGIAAQIVAEIEATPGHSELTSANPFFYTLQCVASHDENLPDSLKTLIRKAGQDVVANKKLVKLLSENPRYRDLIRTTQAVDIINGGVKSNALPETTTFVVNQRIAIEHTVADAKDKILDNVLSIAKKFDLGVTAFGDFITPGDEAKGSIDIEYFGLPLEVAPHSPTSGPTWDLIVGTALHIFKDEVYPKDKNVFAAPGIMTGNTDTRHYWDLTDAIYRFNPVRESAAFGIHTVDEHLEFQSHLETIAYYYEFIQNNGEPKK